MIKELIGSIIIVGLLTGCTEEGSTVTGGGGDDVNSELVQEEVVDLYNSCAVGKYAFTTIKDNKTHFTAVFSSGGRIRFQLKDGPSGTWTYVEDKITVKGPLGFNKSSATLNFKVTKVGSDCKVQRFEGKSKGGSDMAIIRL